MKTIFANNLRKLILLILSAALVHPTYSQDQEVAAVPIQAILFEEDRSELRSEHFIFINDDGVARKTQVEVGLFIIGLNTQCCGEL